MGEEQYILILLILTSGFVSLKQTHFFKYRIRKYSGQELFFSSAFVGLLIYLFGFIIWLPYMFSCSGIYTKLNNYIGNESILFIVSGWMLTLPIIHFVLNYFLTNEYAITKYIEDQNDGIENLLKKAQFGDSAELVSITMSNGKVYIGFVIGQSFFSPLENKSFQIYTMYSGYRDNQTHELFLTNKYVDLIQRYEETGETDKIDDFVVALSMNSVISVSNFNIDVYTDLQIGESLDDFELEDDN